MLIKKIHVLIDKILSKLGKCDVFFFSSLQFIIFYPFVFLLSKHDIHLTKCVTTLCNELLCLCKQLISILFHCLFYFV